MSESLEQRALRIAKEVGYAHESQEEQQCVIDFARRLTAEQDKAKEPVDALDLAIVFHHVYESLAPNVGYDTRKETRIFDPETPNGKLMVATCAEVLRRFNFTAEQGEPTACDHDFKHFPQVSKGLTCHKCGYSKCRYPDCGCSEPWDCPLPEALGKSEKHVAVASPPQAQDAQGEPVIKVSDVRAMLEAGKVAGKDYLYFFKPSEIEAWFRASPIAQAPVAQDGMVPEWVTELDQLHSVIADGTNINYHDAMDKFCRTVAMRWGDLRAMLSTSPSPTTPDQDAQDAKLLDWVQENKMALIPPEHGGHGWMVIQYARAVGGKFIASSDNPRHDKRSIRTAIEKAIDAMQENQK